MFGWLNKDTVTSVMQCFMMQLPKSNVSPQLAQGRYICRRHAAFNVHTFHVLFQATMIAVESHCFCLCLKSRCSSGLLRCIELTQMIWKGGISIKNKKKPASSIKDVPSAYRSSIYSFNHYLLNIPCEICFCFFPLSWSSFCWLEQSDLFCGGRKITRALVLQRG